jgi:hypothetical protein
MAYFLKKLPINKTWFAEITQQECMGVKPNAAKLKSNPLYFYRNHGEMTMNILPDGCGPFVFHFTQFPALPGVLVCWGDGGWVCVCGGVGVCVGVFVYVRVCARVRVYKCRNAGLSGIRSVQYPNQKTNDARTGPVPDQTKAVRPFFWSGTGTGLK